MSVDRVTIALAPLDERPVNTRYPQMIGAIAGADILLPPEPIRGLQRDPADLPSIVHWFKTVGSTADAAIASIEYLGYGNLINSRISGEGTTEVIPRLNLLAEFGKSGKPVYAFNLITRIPNANDCVEEPLYWKQYGTRLHLYSQLLHRREAGSATEEDQAKITRLETEIPVDLRADWLHRRLRNHIINQTLIDLLARQQISFLLVTSDDTSEWGLATTEKVWLEHWMSLLSPTIAGRLLIHPGADEVGSALTARLLCQLQGKRPTICPIYAIQGGEQIIAPYEDRAVWRTVEGQIRACGAEVTTQQEEADILLLVLPPSPRRTEFRQDFADSERSDRQEHFRRHFAQLAEWQKQGRVVAIGDVSYPNGSDPIAMELLLSPDSPVNLAGLAAYGGWNTAGNTLGTVVAQAVASLFIADHPERQTAQAQFLAHRFLEDYGYQVLVRRKARQFCTEQFGHHDPDPENPDQVAAVCQVIEAELTRVLTAELQPRGIGAGMRLAPGSVRLPWRRTFEVDFMLVPI